MLQIYLVRHGETEWNVSKRIQGQSDSALTTKGIHQVKKLAIRMQSLGINHIISSDLGRTIYTAKKIADICNCEVNNDPRLRELDMGILETRYISSLTVEEENWRRQLVNGTKDGRIPGGESIHEMVQRIYAVLNDCLRLPHGTIPLLVGHAISFSSLIITILGLPAYAKRHLWLRNCSMSCINYQQGPWLATGWTVETTGDISHLV